MRRLYREYFGSEPPNLRAGVFITGGGRAKRVGGEFSLRGRQVERFFEDEVLDFF